MIECHETKTEVDQKKIKEEMNIDKTCRNSGPAQPLSTP